MSAFYLTSNYLSSQAVSSQVLSAYMGLTTVFGRNRWNPIASPIDDNTSTASLLRARSLRVRIELLRSVLVAPSPEDSHHLASIIKYILTCFRNIYLKFKRKNTHIMSAFSN